MISKRKFTVVGFEPGCDIKFNITLDEIFLNTDDVESIYAIREDVEEILGLKIGETLFVNLSRDDKNSLGVIKRIL